MNDRHHVGQWVAAAVESSCQKWVHGPRDSRLLVSCWRARGAGEVRVDDRHRVGQWVAAAVDSSCRRWGARAA
ncbi:hypothetical protein [Nocardia sp. NPDC059228]|uniref:hypothetical protein n=1 Tax=Nocardia sp. NPDC059228 TaxID=3346777 RepID=UPI00367C6525